MEKIFNTIITMFIVFVLLFLCIAIWDLATYIISEYWTLLIGAGIGSYLVQWYKRGK